MRNLLLRQRPQHPVGRAAHRRDLTTQKETVENCDIILSLQSLFDFFYLIVDK